MEYVSNDYIVKQLKSHKCYIDGDFTLKSGQKSTYYVDFRKLVSYPWLLSNICTNIYENILASSTLCKSNTPFKIAGVPYGAVPYASCISHLYNIPMLFVRQEKKTYGTTKQIEGEYNEGDIVILIEDVVTTGNSMIETIEILKQHKLDVMLCICLYDRGGLDNIKQKYSIYTYSLFKHDIFKLSMRERIKKFKSKLVFSNDITNKETFFKVLYQVAPYISFLKIHSDTIENFDNEFVRSLLWYKHTYNFLIIDDRKFSDIGNTVRKQIENYNIHKWADIVTVHGIAGESTLLPIIEYDLHILLIAQMSTANNLITTNYTLDVLLLAQSQDHIYENHIIGFISQDEIKGNFFTFTPGIHANNQTDNYGQTYKKIDDLPQNSFAIVGRHIYESNDPAETAKLYVKN